MTNLVEFITDIDRSEWTDLVAASPVATWFQTPECADFYASLPELMTQFVYGVRESGALKGVVVGYLTKERNPLKQMFTRRAIVIGGPLFSTDISDEAVAFLLKETVRRLDAIYVETRNFNDYSPYRSAFVEAGFEYEPHLDFQVDTSSLQDPLEIIGKHRRRYIRMTLRDGSGIVEHPDLNQVREYYGILSALYKTKVKTPLFPFSFFERLYGCRDARFLLVVKGGTVTGGAVCVCLEGRAVYEWFACGQDGVQKGSYPSSLATYAGIRYAADNGYAMFDFMGAGKPDEPYGVRDFKSEFGGTLVEHGRFKRINSPLLYRLGELGVKILRRI